MLNNKNDTSANLAYKGTITISLIQNNQVISKNIYHNNGRYPLFKALCSFLAGEAAKPPTRIALFNKPSAVQVSPSSSWEDLASSIASCTSFLFLNNKRLDVSDGKVSCIYEVVIPYQVITATSIHAMALFNSDSTTTDGAYAFYKFCNGETWNPLVVDKGADYLNYSIAIEWKLEFENIEKGVNS
jgi:hypothetical protein